MLDRAPSLVHGVRHSPGQRCDDWPFYLLGDIADSKKISRRTGSEAGFYDVDPHPLQLLGDFHFLIAGHADASGLLPVP